MATYFEYPCQKRWLGVGEPAVAATLLELQLQPALLGFWWDLLNKLKIKKCVHIMKILIERHTYTSFTHTYIYTLTEKAYCLKSEKMFK